MIIVDCIADLHGHYPKLEGGDLLIVAGDLTADDSIEGHLAFLGWISAVKYKKVVYIAGNHDNALENIATTKEIYLHKDFPPSRWANEIVYLYDSGTEFEYEVEVPHPASTENVSIDVLVYERRKLKIYGSPWTKRFKGMNPHCMAFTVDTEEELAEKWELIPDDVDILVTHSPPYGIMDEVECYSIGKIISCGSKTLLKRSRQLKNLKLFVYGHVHEGYGLISPKELDETAVDLQPTRGIPTCGSIPYLVNASHVNELYEPVNKPLRIEL